MEIPDVYHIVVCIGPAVYVDADRLMARPGLAFYRVREDAADLAQEIDLALLDHLHCWRTTVFIGGEMARREAAAYGTAWIEDSPTLNEDLFEFWRNATPVPDHP
jgi:hypothetical protein